MQASIDSLTLFCLLLVDEREMYMADTACESYFVSVSLISVCLSVSLSLSSSVRKESLRNYFRLRLFFSLARSLFPSFPSAPPPPPPPYLLRQPADISFLTNNE